MPLYDKPHKAHETLTQGIEERIPNNMPDDYKRHAWESLRRRAAVALYEQIAPLRPGDTDRHYAVRIIEEEKILFHPNEWYGNTASLCLRIRAEITPAKYEKFTIATTGELPVKKPIGRLASWLVKIAERIG